jgi:transposase
MLHLVAREVARLNVEKIDLLGAFNGARECLYHYDPPDFTALPPGCACATGIADPGHVLDPGASDVEYLRKDNLIECSDADYPVLVFIQALHDTILHGGGAYSAHDARDQFAEDDEAPVPPCVADIFETMTVLDKDTYREIMQYGCRCCEDVVVQAAAPARLIEGGLPTEATVAQVVVSKYADHLPLYRQAQIYARQGVNLDRSTLADWVGRAAFLLRPIYDRLLDTLRSSSKLFADETTAPVLDPGRGRTKTGQLFAYARDDRPWCGTDPPCVAYAYAPDRKAARPIAHLAGFRGVLQVDGYAGYKVLAERGEVQLAFCWSHVRRHFYELAKGGAAPIASEALRRIADLYRIEDDIRGRSADERRAVRQTRTRPLVDALQPWLREKLSLISQKTKLADAIRYALLRWSGLCLFLDDGRIEIDNNTVERAIRPLTLNRKNALFAGSDGGAEHWAVIASLIETCKLLRVDPHHYITVTLR